MGRAAYAALLSTFVDRPNRPELLQAEKDVKEAHNEELGHEMHGGQNASRWERTSWKAVPRDLQQPARPQSLVGCSPFFSARPTLLPIQPRRAACRALRVTQSSAGASPPSQRLSTAKGKEPKKPKKSLQTRIAISSQR
jgi:hypothetical protein